MFVTHPVLKLIRGLLFSAVKDWEISKPYQAILYLNEWILVRGKTFQVLML